MQVKEGQKRRTEGEQGPAEFKRLTLQGRNNKARQFRNSGTADIKTLYPSIQFDDKVPCGVQVWDTVPTVTSMIDYRENPFGSSKV